MKFNKNAEPILEVHDEPVRVIEKKEPTRVDKLVKAYFMKQVEEADADYRQYDKNCQRYQALGAFDNALKCREKATACSQIKERLITILIDLSQ